VSGRILVAGLGNVFFGDDGFGVHVVDRFAREARPAGVEVMDVGVRGLHLAYRLLEGYELVVAVDAVARGGAPGTLYLIEPDLAQGAALPEAHGASLGAVAAMVEALGGRLGRALILGCEPESFDGMRLSPAVATAVEPAVRRLHTLVKGGPWDVEQVASST
jgi:hydrogenase maturation protease